MTRRRQIKDDIGLSTSSKINPADYITSRKIDPTLGGKLDPYDYIDDYEAKMMFNASKHDVDVARAGGAKIGSIGQRILGDSGGYDENGQYIADPKLADPNRSLINAINKFGFNTVYNEVGDNIATSKFLDSNGINAFNEAYNQELKERQAEDYYVNLGLPEEDIKVLINLDNKGGASKASNKMEFKALHKVKLLKQRYRDEVTPAQALEKEYKKTILKLKREYPVENLGIMQIKNITDDELNYATKDNYKYVLSRLAKKRILNRLNNEMQIDPNINNIDLMKFVDTFGNPLQENISVQSKNKLINITKERPEENQPGFFSNVIEGYKNLFGSKTEGQPETKVANGVTYVRVGEGWKRAK